MKLKTMDELIKKIQLMLSEHSNANWCKDYYEAETLSEAWEAGKYETLMRLLDYIKEL